MFGKLDYLILNPHTVKPVYCLAEWCPLLLQFSTYVYLWPPPRDIYPSPYIHTWLKFCLIATLFNVVIMKRRLLITKICISFQFTLQLSICQFNHVFVSLFLFPYPCIFVSDVLFLPWDLWESLFPIQTTFSFILSLISTYFHLRILTPLLLPIFSVGLSHIFGLHHLHPQSLFNSFHPPFSLTQECNIKLC